jgi:hypothetical protein
LVSRLWPFAPAILIFVGALIVAIGGFWASFRQSNFNAELRQKNEEIARLQSENTGFITGGDSFPELIVAHATAREPDKFRILVRNHGRFPLYDVQVRFVDLGAVEKSIVLSVGNIPPDAMTETNYIITHERGEDINYNVFFFTRNGPWTQNMRMKFVDNEEARASRVFRGTQTDKEVWREVSKNFPLESTGEVKW